MFTKLDQKVCVVLFYIGNMHWLMSDFEKTPKVHSSSQNQCSSNTTPTLPGTWPDHSDPKFRSLPESCFLSSLGGEHPSSSLDCKRVVSTRSISQDPRNCPSRTQCQSRQKDLRVGPSPNHSMIYNPWSLLNMVHVGHLVPVGYLWHGKEFKNHAKKRFENLKRFSDDP